MTRRYARSIGGARAVDSAPVNRPKNTTILSSVRLDGTIVYTTFTGGTTAQQFAKYLQSDLLPCLDRNAVIIMDNMRSHHTKLVTDLLEHSGFHYLYLPPYSPDLNPIEKLWSKIKAFLRKKKIRRIDDLPSAIGQAFETIAPSDCFGWFCSCGYVR